MTGLEVWKAWEKNPDLEFKEVITQEKIVLRDGGVYWKEQSEVVSVSTFMLGNWYPAEGWRKINFIVAIVAWVDGCVIKSVNENGLEFIYTSSGLDDQMGMPLFRSEANYSDWYVKED